MAKYLDYSGLSYLWGKIRAYVGAATGSNYNLLDNAYFVGGGSQSGNEVFPINSRGKTYYEAVNGAYYFDRWKSDSPWASPVKCGFQNEGVVLAGDVTPGYPTAYAQLTQVISNPPVGKTVTLSILTDNVSSDNEDSPPFLLTNNSVWTPITIGLTKVTFVWASGVNSVSIIVPDGETSAASLRMQAIKLEIGEFSTIENDSAPDYGVELARCIYSKADPSDTYANNGFGRSNKNLLDNWYFVGGGSQLGDGHFPINQREQTSYTSAGFVFDRWFKSGGVTATLDAGGLTIANSNGWPDGINQRFPMHFFAQMNGEAITASVLYADGSVDSGTAIIDATQNYQWLKYPDAGEIGFQLKNFQDGAAYDYFDYISFGAGAGSTPKKIKAVKLEFGTVSTLANDTPPDFGEELRKCMRRLYIHDYAANDPISSGIAANQNIYLPVAMAKGGSPTVSFTVTPYVIGAGVVDTPTSVGLVSLKDNVVCLYVPTNTPIGNNAACLYAVSATRLTVSNEL